MSTWSRVASTIPVRLSVSDVKVTLIAPSGPTKRNKVSPPPPSSKLH
ncbi:MAG: hypothetical protein U0794_20920 [Isosphaeraceae bacterium]